MKSFGRRSSVVGPSLFRGPSDRKEFYEAVETVETGAECGGWQGRQAGRFENE